MKKIKKGSIIQGQVTGIEKYGIFVNIDSFYNGLIHISEISDGFVRNVNDYINIGETIFAKVLEVDEEHLQVKLSIKNINYKNKKDFPKVVPLGRGFELLAKKLKFWTEEKLEELK